MKIVVRAFAVFILVGGIFVSSFAAPPAQAGILEFFFPSLRQAPEDPTNTLQAPFAYEGKKKKLELIEDESEKPDPLDTPHRMSAEIGEWLTSILSETLTFEGDDYQVEMEEERQYFDPTGRAAYIDFLEKNKIIKILESKKYVMRSFVEEEPIVLNEGAVGGVYHWLFQVPVLVSYMDRDMNDYNKGDVTTQHITLTVQVGRSATASDRGVVVEQWDAKVGKIVAPKGK